MLGISRDGVGSIGSPHGDTRFLVGDVVTVLGQGAQVRDVLSRSGAQSTPITDLTATIDGGGGTWA